jgi:hypothetical protein
MTPTWPLICFALETYLHLHGDSRIPGDFIVPYESSDWPEELWDMELGTAVGKMRYTGHFKRHRPEWRRWALTWIHSGRKGYLAGLT